MKIVADDGTEHEPRTRTAAHALISRLMADARHSPLPRPGHHIEKLWRSDLFRFKIIRAKKETVGPSRPTREEAAEDFRRYLAGEMPLPNSPERRKRYSDARKRSYAAQKAASPDGEVHLAPPTCSFCGETGHRSNHCQRRRDLLMARVRNAA
jgi:hypothetical protein